MQTLSSLKQLAPSTLLLALRSGSAYSEQQTRCYAKKINSAKKEAKKAPGRSEDTDAVDPWLKTLLEQLKPIEVDKDNLTEEQLAEYEKRAKEYSSKKMSAHRLLQSRLSRKLRIKNAAFDALPAALKGPAWKDDFTLMSPSRMPPMETPPIKTYRAWKARQEAGEL